ncbi:MAG: cadmium-translocating P-type ATPase [Oscillospiraceae bacterium]|nr:cadmium-translocating P-type ATPase [Oscillospiraceae bacterium]
MAHTHHHEHHGCGCHGHCHSHGHETNQRREWIEIGICVLLFLAALLIPAEGYWKPGLFLVPYIFAGWRIWKEALEGLFHGELLDENFLMAAASLGALIIGEYPEAVAVLVLYRVGEAFQSYAEGRSRRSIRSLMKLHPETAEVETESGIVSVPTEEVEPGSILVVKPGGRIPLDGTVLSGSAMLDTAALTGEAEPRAVQPGDPVRNGCVSLDGVLRIRGERRLEESTVSRIMKLVEDAEGRKAAAETFITRFARVYTPVVVICAVLLAVVPSLITGDWAQWVRRGITFLVISCPCALVISVPLSFFGGIGSASRRGILIKGSGFVEALARADTVVFDKTGTLTTGEFTVTEVHPVGMEREELLFLAASAEYYSTHPVGKAVREAAEKVHAPENVREYPGQGITAEADGKTVAVGNLRLMEQLGISAAIPAKQPGVILHAAVNGVYAGYILAADTEKPAARAAVKELEKLGVRRTVMLSGDRRENAEPYAKALGLQTCRAELTPEGKAEAMEELTAAAGKGTVLYAGDGINDAPVLARADVGIAMGALGADAAVEASDVVLMDDDPMGIVRAIRIARGTMAIVVQNVVFAIGIKILLLVCGALGYASIWLAVFGDVGVAVLAVLNAMRALRLGRKA